MKPKFALSSWAHVPSISGPDKTTCNNIFKRSEQSKGLIFLSADKRERFLERIILGRVKCLTDVCRRVIQQKLVYKQKRATEFGMEYDVLFELKAFKIFPLSSHQHIFIF
jgi:hypothetical protein